MTKNPWNIDDIRTHTEMLHLLALFHYVRNGENILYINKNRLSKTKQYKNMHQGMKIYNY